ncbi:MFS transporter [Clostridium sp. YIM B02515]|uniref:MFS transporter n=1 Tax=Clostridium rhizosphaerae TaxID=2803861 RepID=A0ABS1TKT7_9CLOT|nr:MFS transporter [Clostridium rhizosphaerae]MBL4938588.1 MFS transporter [Clostridium rhizosphaerae]
MNIISKLLKPYKNLPMSVYVIFFASIINNLGNFVAPFLTMFLTYSIGMKVETVGIIVAINSFVGLVASAHGGKLIDIIGRKKIFIIFRTTSAIALLSCAFTRNPIILTVLLILSNFLGGYSLPVYSTIITDITEGEQRNTAFSLQYMALNIGFSVGPLLAGFLYNNYLIWLFLGDAATTFISVILVALFIPETMPDKLKISSSKNNKLEHAEEGSLLQALIKRPTLVLFSFIIILYFIVFSQFNFGLSLQVSEVFKNKSAAVFGSLMTVNAVLCSIIPMFLTALTGKIKASLSMVAGGMLYAVGFGMIFFIHSYFLFVISAMIWTMGEILIATNTNVYIADHTPASHRGRFNSIFPIIRKLGFMIGPIIAGLYVKYTNIRNLWLFLGVLSIIGAVMMYRLHLIDNKANEISASESA